MIRARGIDRALNALRFYRWINIFITLGKRLLSSTALDDYAYPISSLLPGIWALELNIEDEYDDDGESIKSWKVD
jgi:hypothetical protein